MAANPVQSEDVAVFGDHGVGRVHKSVLVADFLQGTAYVMGWCAEEARLCLDKMHEKT